MYPRIILFIFFPLFGFSQAPQKINFQSILRNTNGEVVANKNVKLKISIQSGSMMDTTVYSETHLKTTDVSGLMSLKIGTGTSLMGRFDSIKWGKASHFIKLEADFNGGNNFVLLGTQELMSVPYAFHSNTADSLVGGINLKDIKDELANLRRQMDTLLLAPVFDIDGNQYGVVKIGNVLWLNQNLKVSRYNNGDSIGYGTNWVWMNDSSSNDALYGKLYSSNAANDNRNICPKGWKIPNYRYNPNLFYEFVYFNGPNNQPIRADDPKKLMVIEAGGTNEYGWNGRLGGMVSKVPNWNFFFGNQSVINQLGILGIWWSDPDLVSGPVGFYFRNYDGGQMQGTNFFGQQGLYLSVRCVKNY
jgi:uncharacterized protein (TIGR02145 family)